MLGLVKNSTQPTPTFLSRSSVDQSTVVRRRGSRVQVAPGQPVRKVVRGGTQPVPKTGPTSRSRVRLLHLPPFLLASRVGAPREHELERQHDMRVPLLPPVCKTGVCETGRSADERFESSGAHHADVVDWFNAGAPLRRKEFDSPRPHQFAWEANLVKAPRRKRGEVGSKPTPGTILLRAGALRRTFASNRREAGCPSKL
jgi:hypothetical protein